LNPQWKEKWASLPPLYKKHLFQALGAYLLVLILAGGWVYLHKKSTIEQWDAKIPHASADIRTVFQTPQITENSTDSFSNDPANNASGKTAYIGLVVTGGGLSKEQTDRAIADMPPAVAIAFSPYADNLTEQLNAARKVGHETLALIPMEPFSYPKDDPGPLALLTRSSLQKNEENLATVMRLLRQVDGAMNFMGSAFLNNQNVLSPVFAALREKKMYFVEDSSSMPTAVETVARQETIKRLPALFHIDDITTENDIRSALVRLEKEAREKGFAIGIANPYPLTYNMIKAWSDTLDSRGYKIVPLKDIIAIKESQDADGSPQPTEQPAAAEPPAPPPTEEPAGQPAGKATGH
jgi:polysaccharide deacetylase 2 family uncharacterized protein YibQ